MKPTPMNDDAPDQGALLAELKQLCQEARDYQERHKLSTAQLIRRYQGLGSDKTLGLLASGDPEKLADLDLERWLVDYRAVVNLMRALDEKAEQEDPVYEDFNPVTQLRLAVMEAMRETGNNRFVLVLGPSGSGKSTAAMMLQTKWGTRRVLLVQADESWKKNLPPMLDALLRALGNNHPPRGSAHKVEEVVKKLTVGRICLVIDEAHHMGPPNLNMIKTLINRTPGEFVLLAMDSLWRRLEWTDYEECRQLTQNRLCERVQLGTPQEADVARMVERRTGHKPDHELVKLIRTKATLNGHMAFVKLVCRKAIRLAGKEPVSAEHLGTAVVQVLATR